LPLCRYDGREHRLYVRFPNPLNEETPFVPSIDFDAVGQWVDLSENVRQMLIRPEKQIVLNLSVHLGTNELLMTDCFVVLQNAVRGPAKGGIRLAPNVTLEETRDLAERMVWKTALVRIPFGGGKSGIRLDPATLSYHARIAIFKEYVHILKHELMSGEYIPAPDLGTGPSDMAVIYGETHVLESVTGKPTRVGGLPGRKEATGRGVAAAARLALDAFLRQDVHSSTVAVQGFGNVGSYAALFLHEAGAKVVAVSDVTGALYNPKGLDVPALIDHVLASRSLAGAVGGEPISNQDLLALPVDVLAPCAVENVLTATTAATVRARLIVEGANGPTTPDADRVLNQAGIPVVPDILANAGGVIASYIEWRSAKSGSITKKADVYADIERLIGETFADVHDSAKRNKVSLRRAAEVSAVREVVESMRERGWV
jgi:glutamate dehydrogenase (NAD(P)+)